MKLLIWTENYWIGGCDRFLVDLIEGLASEPLSITMAGNLNPEFDAWLTDRVPNLLPRETLPIANLVRSPLHAIEARVRRSDGEGPHANDSGDEGHHPVRAVPVAALRYSQAVLNFVRLRGLMARIRPDALLINNGGYPGGESCRMAALAAKAEGISHVVHFVHNMAYPPAIPRGLERGIDHRIDLATDAWATAAHRASDALADQRSIAPEKIRTVHYGVGPAPPPVRGPEATALRRELGLDDDTFAIAMIANMEARKGHTVLLESLIRCREHGIPPRVVVVGDGPLEMHVRRQAVVLGLDRTVTFVGRREDVHRILSVVDALVLPSLKHECLPYVILEAMSHGLPVISTDVAGIPEMVVNNETGRIVAPGDPTALANAIAEVAADPTLAAAMGRRGLQRVRQEFALPTMISSMVDLLRLSPQQS